MYTRLQPKRKCGKKNNQKANLCVRGQWLRVSHDTTASSVSKFIIVCLLVYPPCSTTGKRRKHYPSSPPVITLCSVSHSFLELRGWGYGVLASTGGSQLPCASWKRRKGGAREWNLPLGSIWLPPVEY